VQITNLVLEPVPRVLAPIPLPAPVLLLAGGLALLGLLRRRVGRPARP
jgi:hypothetical protein